MAKLVYREPWQRLSWKPEALQSIYRDWGDFYTRQDQLELARKHYDKAMELKEDSPAVLYQLSKCKRDAAEPEEAVLDAVKASKYREYSSPIDLEVCDGMYETNDFERTKLELHDRSRKFHGSKIEAFRNRMDVVNENFNDSVGETLAAFFLENEQHLPAIMEELQEQRKPHTRQSWKIKRDLGKCDVMSLPDIEEVRLPPIETAKRQRSFKIFNQVYQQNSWIDVLFLKELRLNEILLLPQSYYSTPILRQTTNETYDKVNKFTKMLQARSPMYNEMAKKFPNKKIREEHKTAYLYRVQYQTRRNLHKILKNARLLREMGKVEKLSQFIEDVMGDYVALKTHRIIPWKYEFIHEIYNILALAYADRYVIPDDLEKYRPADHLTILLRLPEDKSKDHKDFVFGDRSTYQQLNISDQYNSPYKKIINRLEKRQTFSLYGIEKAYLSHEIARIHLVQGHFDDCLLTARKAISDAKKCGSKLWELHSKMLIVKSLSILHKIERTRDMLENIKGVVSRLKDPKITEFVDFCFALKETEISMKKRTQSHQSFASKRFQSVLGIYSSSSIRSSQSLRSRKSG